MQREASKEQTQKKRSPLTALKFVLIVAGGILFGRLVSSLFGGGDSAEISNVSALLLIPSLIVAILLVLALHEAGHVIGGKLTGGRLTIFVVGPLKLQATNNGIEVGLNKSLALAGGIGGTAPTSAENLRRKMAIMTAGGPVMSFVVAGVAFALGRFLDGGLVGVVSQAVTLMSLLVALVTLMPIKNGGFFTDGRRLIMLLKGGPQAERWCAISALSGASMFGERPREWNGELIEKSLALKDGSLDDAGASINAFHRALDRDRTEEAKSLLLRAMDATEIPEFVRTQALLEAAFFYAYFEGNPGKARALYSKANPKSALEKHLLLRAGSAVLLAEGRTEEARDEARLALKSIGKSMSPGTARLETEWLQDLEDGRSAAHPPCSPGYDRG